MPSTTINKRLSVHTGRFRRREGSWAGDERPITALSLKLIYPLPQVAHDPGRTTIMEMGFGQLIGTTGENQQGIPPNAAWKEKQYKQRQVYTIISLGIGLVTIPSRFG